MGTAKRWNDIDGIINCDFNLTKIYIIITHTVNTEKHTEDIIVNIDDHATLAIVPVSVAGFKISSSL